MRSHPAWQDGAKAALRARTRLSGAATKVRRKRFIRAR